MNTQRRFCRKYKRADVQGCFRFRRYPVSFHIYQCLNCLNKQFFRNGSHAETFIGIDHTSCIHLRTEQLNLTICSSVCFQSFESFLCIVKYYSSRAHRNRTIWHNGCIMPANAFIIIHHKHIIGKILTKSQLFLIWFFLQLFSFYKFDIHNNFLLLYQQIRGISLSLHHATSIKLHFSHVNRKSLFSVAFVRHIC